MPDAKAVRLPVLKWLVVLGSAAWLSWRIVALGMANQAMLENSPGVALRWYPEHPQANLADGLKHFQNHPEYAESRLREAITANPAESRGYAALGQLLEHDGARGLADRAMNIAAAMGPQRSDVQLDVTAYQLRQGRFPLALQHWNTVLRHQPGLRTQLFPALLSGAEDPANQAAFEEMLQQPVSWWSEFVTYASRQATNLDTARRLYRLSHTAVNALSNEALQAYLERLQKDGEWTEAWFTWLNTLSREEIAQSGYVYNGSFETRLSNLGFDWIYRRDPAVVMETATTYGTTGERALHLIFPGKRIKFEHLQQYLLLPAGSYYLSGRARPDNLKTNQGMQWAVYCLGTQEPLAVSDRFRGMDQWTRFRSRFEVPAGCPVQLLRLELGGRITLDYDVSGGIWFDDLGIEQAVLQERG